MIPTMNEFLKSILDGINSFIGNYGWSVVIFTLLIKLVLMPFDYKSRVSMRKTQALQPKLNELQKRYANDKEKLNKKMAELYQKEKISPMSSCLPMLLTMPVLFAMFAAMRLVAGENMVAQTFAILQGSEPVMESWLWVKNIWMPDSPFYGTIVDQQNLNMIPADIWSKVLSGLDTATVSLLADKGVIVSELQGMITAGSKTTAIGQTLFPLLQATEAYQAEMALWHELPKLNLLIMQLTIYAKPNGWFILPILACVTQLLMSSTTQQPQQPQAEGQPNTGAFMKYFFPLFSLFICSSYNAAFSVYWVVSNIFAWAEQLIFNKVFEMQDRAGNNSKSVKEEDSIK